MRKTYFVFLMLITAFLLQGCHHVFIHSSPGIRIRHKKVVKRPVYVEEEEEYYDDEEDAYEEYEEDQYEDADYEETDYREYVETDVSVDIFVGTAFAIYGTRYLWCDYCCCWHPRCTPWRCYCHPVVIRHYGFFHNHVYRHHCYHWHYEPHYRPAINRFRVRHGTGRYYTYSVAQKRREFARSNGVGISAERVRYRGKDEIKFTYDKSRNVDTAKRTVTRTGDSTGLSKTSVVKRETSDRSRSVSRSVSKTTSENSSLNRTSASRKTVRSTETSSRSYEKSSSSDRKRNVSEKSRSSRSREYTKKSSSSSSRLSKIGNSIKRSVPKVAREINKSRSSSGKSRATVKKVSKPKKAVNRTKKTAKKKGG